MPKPTKKEYQTVKKLLHSNDLEYKEAMICMDIVKAFIWNKEVSNDSISELQNIRYSYNEN